MKTTKEKRDHVVYKCEQGDISNADLADFARDASKDLDTLETQLAQCNQLKEADNAALKRSESRLEEYRKLLERAEVIVRGNPHSSEFLNDWLEDYSDLMEKKDE